MLENRVSRHPVYDWQCWKPEKGGIKSTKYQEKRMTFLNDVPSQDQHHSSHNPVKEDTQGQIKLLGMGICHLRWSTTKKVSRSKRGKEEEEEMMIQENVPICRIDKQIQ